MSRDSGPTSAQRSELRALRRQLRRAQEHERATSEEAVADEAPARSLRGLEIQEPEPTTHPYGGPGDGVAYFVERMFSEHPQWSLWALEASAEEARERVAELWGVERGIADARAEAPASAAFECFLLQLDGHRWTLLLRSYGDLQGLGQTAQELSQALATRAVAFGHRETDGASIARVFERGKPGKKARNRRAWDDFFRRLQLFVPYFGLYSEEGRTQLFVEGVEESQVQSCSYLPLDREPR